jgi:CoA binding domain
LPSSGFDLCASRYPDELRCLQVKHKSTSSAPLHPLTLQIRFRLRELRYYSHHSALRRTSPPGQARLCHTGRSKVLWLQLGIRNDEAAGRAEAAGLTAVQDRCTKIEHARFFGALHTIGLSTGVILAKKLQVSHGRLTQNGWDKMATFDPGRSVRPPAERGRARAAGDRSCCASTHPDACASLRALRPPTGHSPG